MKIFQPRGILFACAAAAALLTLPAQAQLDDLFRAPGNTHPATPDASDVEPKASQPARQAQLPLQASKKPSQTASISTASPAKAHDDRVVIYTTPTCPHCIRALKHMNDRKIAYVQKDVQHDQANRAEFKQIGGRGVPHILMGSTVMVGFSPQSFDHKYGVWRAEAGASR